MRPLHKQPPKHSRSPKHARSTRRRNLVALSGVFALAALLVAVTLVGFGGSGAPNLASFHGQPYRGQQHWHPFPSRHHAPTPPWTTTTIGQHPTTTTTTKVPPSTTTTTHPPATTTTTTTPSSGVIPNAPVSLDAPTTVALDDEFNAGLNTSLWSPTWFGNGSTSNGTVMEASNVAVTSTNGLALTLAANGTGGIVSSNPSDGQSGHTGFQIAPTSAKPVYVEFKVTLPASANGQVANWPALWLDGQSWPADGEIDVMEGLGGQTAFHIHYGSGSGQAQGASTNTGPGTHTFGVLWTTTGVVFVYDGQEVGALSESMTSPMYLLMENSNYTSNLSVLPAVMDVRYVRVWN